MCDRGGKLPSAGAVASVLLPCQVGDWAGTGRGGAVLTGGAWYILTGEVGR